MVCPLVHHGHGAKQCLSLSCSHYFVSKQCLAPAIAKGLSQMSQKPQNTMQVRGESAEWNDMERLCKSYFQLWNKINMNRQKALSAMLWVQRHEIGLKSISCASCAWLLQYTVHKIQMSRRITTIPRSTRPSVLGVSGTAYTSLTPSVFGSEDTESIRISTVT